MKHLLNKYQFLFLLLILFGLGSVNVHAQVREQNNTKQYDLSWKGYLGDHQIPVFLHYQTHQKLVTGEIIYLNTKAKMPISVIGTKYEYGRIRLREFEPDGNITGVMILKPKQDSLIGSWYKPYSKTQYTMSLTREDTLIPSTPIAANLNSITGDYSYHYGEKGYQGEWKIMWISQDSIAIGAWSVTSAPGRNIANIGRDTVALNGNHFIYKVGLGQKCRIVMKGTFYSDFLQVSYINDDPCHYYFGFNATLEGIFFKTKAKNQ